MAGTWGANCSTFGHHVGMTRDWMRLAKAIAEARRALGWNQEELAEAADIGRGTVQNLEGVGGYQYKRLPSSSSAVERALGWGLGSMSAILAGGSPLPAEAQQEAQALPRERSPFAPGIPLRVREELSSGDVVDTVVMDLSDDSRGIKLVAVLKAEDAEGVDPDEMRETLHRWAQAQRKLHGLPTSDSSD